MEGPLIYHTVSLVDVRMVLLKDHTKILRGILYMKNKKSIFVSSIYF